MGRTLDVRTALYGVHYDLGERLTQSNQPLSDLDWLEKRVIGMRRSIELLAKYRRSQQVKQHERRSNEQRVVAVHAPTRKSQR